MGRKSRGFYPGSIFSPVHSSFETAKHKSGCLNGEMKIEGERIRVLTQILTVKNMIQPHCILPRIQLEVIKTLQCCVILPLTMNILQME